MEAVGVVMILELFSESIFAICDSEGVFPAKPEAGAGSGAHARGSGRPGFRAGDGRGLLGAGHVGAEEGGDFPWLLKKTQSSVGKELAKSGSSS